MSTTSANLTLIAGIAMFCLAAYGQTNTTSTATNKTARASTNAPAIRAPVLPYDFVNATNRIAKQRATFQKKIDDEQGVFETAAKKRGLASNAGNQSVYLQQNEIMRQSAERRDAARREIAKLDLAEFDLYQRYKIPQPEKPWKTNRK